jgi:catechol 2,3-dioxygenase-like lactoylglutathione lyase family enzyme
MVTRKVLSLVLAVSVIVMGSLGSTAQEKKPASPPIRQVDHILIRADDPERLHSFFTKTLDLPVAWPLTPYKGFTTGGVGFGNVNIEVFRVAEQGSPPDKPTAARLVGIALEPAPLADCLSEQDKRGIAYGEKRPYDSPEPGGAKKKLWTTVILRQFSDGDRFAHAGTIVFLCEYSPDFWNVNEQRKRLREQLAARKGGPLGVDSVKEILIGTTDLEKATGLWQKLLDPTPASAPGVWQLGSGPAIRLVPAKENAIQGLVISVKSLAKAKAFLREKGLLGNNSDKEANVEPSKIEGLNIRLVEER